MIDKSVNNEKAIIVRDIVKKHGLKIEEEQIERFIIMNRNYKAHVLMVGGYSAGKSALLNKYIGKSILEENQAPETNVATELYFSEKERILAVPKDGKKYEISDMRAIDINQIKNVEYYVNSENIKSQYDYIFVDTPGFDSGIKEHNKALTQYIGEATAFILVVDCEKGTLSESALNFICEIFNYSTDVGVIINKCDKKIAEDVQEVKEHIEDLLFGYTGRKLPIVCTSIYDDDVEEKIEQLVSGFNPETLYEKYVTEELRSIERNVIDSLEVLKKEKHVIQKKLMKKFQKEKLFTKKFKSKLTFKKIIEIKTIMRKLEKKLYLRFILN